jgi:hypothetical protein
MKRTLLLVAVLLAAASVLWAQQTTGQISGTIEDSTGAAIAGAQVSVTDPGTGFTRSTVTSGTGNYNLTFLPPGGYNLQVKASGFATLEQKNIVVAVGAALTVNHQLKPGAASEVVTVTEEAPMVQTSSSEIGGSVSPNEVKELPILDRNFASLMTLIPGVRQAEGFDPTKTRVGNVSINGGDGRQVEANVDGGNNKDLVVGGMVQNFTMEGIQEFNVVTDHYTAEAGHSVGGVVNVISKSGTNTLHGSAFGLFQLSTLNKVNYFEKDSCPAGKDPGRCKKKFHRYDFGGSIGGPIIKDKLFFFGAYEHKREPGSLSVNGESFAELTQFAAQTSGFTGGPYAFPTSSIPFPYTDHMLTAKVDWKTSDRQNWFIRYGRQRWINANDQLGNANTPTQADLSQTQTDTNNFHDLAIGQNYVISPTKVNSLNLHFQDMVNAILAAPSATFTYPVAGGGTATNPNLIFPDGTNNGFNVNVPQETLIRKYQIRDDFTWTHGRHNMKFGGNWIYFAKTGGYFFFGASGYQVTFWDDPRCIQTGACPAPDGSGGVYASGISTPGAVREIAFSGGSGDTAQPPWHSLGLYYQDDIKVTHNLTLNLGVRWDANIGFLRPMSGSTMQTSNRTVWALEQAAAAPSNASTSDALASIQQIVGNQSDLNRTTADWKEFQPRVGFAWDIFGNGKHVLRGGYGIARDQIFQNLTLFSLQQTRPTIYQTLFDYVGDNPTTGCTPPAVGFNICGFQFGVDPLPPTPTAAIDDLSFGGVGRMVNPKVTDPWSQQFSLGWAWQVHPDYAFSIDWYHTLGTHEERVLNANPQMRTICNPAYGGNPLDPRCVNGINTRLLDPAFAAAGVCAPDISSPTGTSCGAGRLAQIYEYSTNNRSMYDGINFQLRKRMSKRFMFQTSYVLSWSRSWGGFPVASYGGSGLAVTPDQQFRPEEFNRTNFDERHRFVFSGLFEAPWGIQLSPIFTAASARPYSELAGSDINGDGRSTIDRVCQGSTPTTWTTTPGCTMLKPNTVSGKPFVQMDLRTAKIFRIGERVNLRLYAEFYNLFNRANFCNDYSQTVTGGFGTPLGFCSGPDNNGYSAAAVPSLHTQWGFRFEF